MVQVAIEDLSKWKKRGFQEIGRIVYDTGYVEVVMESRYKEKRKAGVHKWKKDKRL